MPKQGVEPRTPPVQPGPVAYIYQHEHDQAWIYVAERKWYGVFTSVAEAATDAATRGYRIAHVRPK